MYFVCGLIEEQVELPALKFESSLTEKDVDG